MPAQTINLPEDTLYPSPRNEHRMIFEFQLFVPYAYELIHLPDYNFKGKATLFGARRHIDGKMGQLISCELADDLARFERMFEPD